MSIYGQTIGLTDYQQGNNSTYINRKCPQKNVILQKLLTQDKTKKNSYLYVKHKGIDTKIIHRKVQRKHGNEGGKTSKCARTYKYKVGITICKGRSVRYGENCNGKCPISRLIIA